MILDVTQGSPEWLQARKNYFCASDAPVVMGTSKHGTRAQLLRLKASGDEREVSEWVQRNLLDRGHELEAAARLIVEERLGDELYPVVAVDEGNWLLASSDGITMDGRTGFEHKSWNAELAAAVKAGEVPASHYWQLEHQFLVFPLLERILFVVSDGTPERFECVEYRRVPGRAEQLIAGWKQFEQDLKTFTPAEVPPPVRATPVKGLPAVSIQVNGKLALIDNLAEFGARLKAYVADLNKEPDDDQGFADAEHAVKVLKEAEERLKAAEASALAQTASIDEMRRTVAHYVETARTTRLLLEKVVTQRKQQIRQEICQEARAALDAYLDELNQRIGMRYLQAVPADFPGCIKGLKTLTSIRDAVDNELAKARREADLLAHRIEMNLHAIREAKADFLFADEAQLVLKEVDTVKMTVTLRVNEHRAKEKAREEQLRAEAQQRAMAEAERRIAVADPVPATLPGPGAMKVLDLRAGAGHVASRPSDDEIINLLCSHYDVGATTAIEWLRSMNLDTVQKRLAVPF